MTPATDPAATDREAIAEDPNDTTDAPADAAPVSITEAVTTSVTGMVIGGAALWFLAPICFNC